VAIPIFDTDTGALPPGIHVATWAEITGRFGGTPRRLKLLAGLRRACDSLRQAGCSRVYLDGSFVTSKEEPNDFDGCWSAQGVDASKLDPALLDFTGKRDVQKAAFGGELFPAEFAVGTFGGRFLDFFQQDREGRPKGIVAIDLGSEQ